MGGKHWLDLKTLLQLAAELAERGSVLVGLDAALGVPAGYWGALRERDWGMRGRPANFIDWLSRLAPDSNFFEDVANRTNGMCRVLSESWTARRAPRFHGRLFDDEFRRRIDC